MDVHDPGFYNKPFHRFANNKLPPKARSEVPIEIQKVNLQHSDPMQRSVFACEAETNAYRYEYKGVPMNGA